MALLQKENELEEIVKLVGPDVLPETDKLVLLEAEIIRESFLMQYAFHPVDTYSDPGKQHRMITAMFRFFSLAADAVSRGIGVERIRVLPVKRRLARMGAIPSEEDQHQFADLIQTIEQEIGGLEV